MVDDSGACVGLETEPLLHAELVVETRNALLLQVPRNGVLLQFGAKLLTRQLGVRG